MTSLTEYQKFWTDRFQQAEENKKSLLVNFRDLAVQAAEVLERQFNVKKVYLYGSVADGLFFHKYSDMDLAVEGLAPQKYFSALAKLSAISQGKYCIDLLPLEDALPGMKEQIEKKGKLLYG